MDYNNKREDEKTLIRFNIRHETDGKNIKYVCIEDEERDNVEDNDFDEEIYPYVKPEINQNKEEGCYLTSACMQHFKSEFDDNCYELTVLRWFRDNYVSKDDIKLYYNLAPKIVESINKDKRKEEIYDYIYDAIVDECVTAIENGDYEYAYKRYKASILSLKRNFIKDNTKELTI